MPNLSHENEFRFEADFHANQTHIHMKDFAQGLVLKQRHTVTRKWPTFFDTHISRGCKLILNLKSTNEFSQVTIQMKATEQ